MTKCTDMSFSSGVADRRVGNPVFIPPQSIISTGRGPTAGTRVSPVSRSRLTLVVVAEEVLCAPGERRGLYDLLAHAIHLMEYAR